MKVTFNEEEEPKFPRIMKDVNADTIILALFKVPHHENAMGVRGMVFNDCKDFDRFEIEDFHLSDLQDYNKPVTLKNEN